MRQLGLRLLQLVPILFILSVFTFLLVELQPGDPAIAILGENAQPETIAAVRHDLRLDEPLVQRYVDWAGAALRGDLGKSIRSHQPVSKAYKERIPVTFELTMLALIPAFLLSIPLGAWSAYRAGRLFDRGVSTASFAALGLPQFVLGPILVFIFALRFRWFPPSTWVRFSDDIPGNLKHAFLPALTLALGLLANFSQLLRADMVGTLQEDFILAARARGLSTSHVLMREALRPSSFSLITLAGVNLGLLIGGSVIVEQLFGIGGVGQAITQAIPQKDFPMLQGGVLILAVSYLLINTIIDMSYALIDPRVRRGRS
jgi:peptide/nickel transport system permease protein